MKLKKRNNKHNFICLALLALVLIIATAGGFLAYDYFSHQSPQQGMPPPTKTDVDGTKKSAEEKLSYDVPAHRPRQLIIDKLGVDANILPMGILPDGSLEAPKSAWEVGWYERSTLPGTGNGTLLIDGHVNDALGTPGIFYDIHSLKQGDTIKIQRGDMQTFVYEVVAVEQKPIEQVDMAKMLRSAEAGKEGVNLITCGGDYDHDRQTYDDRVLVFAVRMP